MIKRITLVVVACALLAFVFVGCSKKEQEIDKTAAKMDTVIQLRAYGTKADKAVEAAFARIDEIEQIASNTIETSDISKINQAAGKEDVKVHPEIIKMLKEAVQYSKLSDGAFDITVGPIIKLWGINTESEHIPADSEIKATLPLVDYKNISINEADNTVKLLKEGMSIDLGGIAKGYAADEVIKIFKEYNIKSALISLGGSSIYTIGHRPDGKEWTVGVQHPRKPRNESYLGIIKLTEQALSTSGDYERYFEKNGKRYHHILNPFTGSPTDNGVMSVTIIVDNNIPDANMKADILTKTVFVLGVDKGMKIIDSMPGVTCIAETTDYKIYQSANWKTELLNLDPEFTMVK